MTRTWIWPLACLASVVLAGQVWAFERVQTNELASVIGSKQHGETGSLPVVCASDNDCDPDTKYLASCNPETECVNEAENGYNSHREKGVGYYRDDMNNLSTVACHYTKYWDALNCPGTPDDEVYSWTQGCYGWQQQ